MTLACKRCCVTNGYLQRLVCKGFFLKKRKNVTSFLIKSTYLIALLYFLLFAGVSGRFEALIVFGELALFWCSPAKRKTILVYRPNSDFRWKITPGLNSSRNSKQRCCSSMSIHSIRKSSHRSFTSDTLYLLLERLPNVELGSSKLQWTRSPIA